ncbi:MAG: NfeD family protein [Rhizobiales bacterium]|nr:NfeD family protein [Hyphomicrobiales bacterium]
MLDQIFSELGAWNWMAFGFVLLALEILIPGVFLLWIGIAAILTGVVSLQLWYWEMWAWQAQVLLFLVLSLISAYICHRFGGSKKARSDQPLLNQRGAQLLGRTATLTEPISNGRGRIQLGDTLWRVSGPDLPAGARVKVAGVAESDLELVVEPVETR